MALTVSSVWMRSSSPKSMRSDSNALQEGVGPRRAFTALGPVRLASILTPFTVNLMDGVQGCGVHPHTPADPRLSLINWVPSKPPTPSGWRRGWVEQAPRRASPPALKLECRRARAETFFEREDPVPHFRALNQPVSHREQTRICAFHLPVTLSSNCGIGNNGNQYNE